MWYERTKHQLFCCCCWTCCSLAEGSFRAQQISPQTKLQFLCKRMGCHHWAVCGFIVLFFSPLPYSIFTSLLYLSSLHFFLSVCFLKASIFILGNFHFYYNTFQSIIISYFILRYISLKCCSWFIQIWTEEIEMAMFNLWTGSFRWTCWISSLIAMNDSFMKQTDLGCIYQNHHNPKLIGEPLPPTEIRST